MPFSVRVRDFQSIGDVTIEVNGLTIITGPNNSGKTALIRAIFGAFTNTRGTSFVRSGKDSSKVDLSFSDGHKLSWEKGPKVNRYELDGTTLERVGSGAPEDVKKLGVYPIEATGADLWPQFAHQFVGQIFLLDKPGSVLAEAIANIDKVGVLNEALRLSQSDRRSAASDLKVRTADTTRFELELQKFDGLDDLASKVRALGPLNEKIEGGRRSHREILALRERWVSSRDAVSKLLPVRKVEISGSDRIKAGQKAYSEVSGLRDRLVTSKEVLSKLLPAKGITIGDPDLVARAKKTSAALEWVSGTGSRLAKAKSERDLSRKASEGFRAMVLPDPKGALEARDRIEALRTLAEKWKAAKATVGTLTAKLETLRQEHGTSVSEVETLFRESGKCPFCGADHEAHSH